jgi:hypothetical protein
MVETTHNKQSFGGTLTKICLHIKFLGIPTGIITGGDFLFLEHEGTLERQIHRQRSCIRQITECILCKDAKRVRPHKRLDEDEYSFAM